MPDIIIIGGGPAGITAALYCARAGLSVSVLEKSLFGGQMALAEEVENYPAFIESGAALSENMRRQAERFGAEFRQVEVRSVSLTDQIKTVKTAGGVLNAPCVILATGAAPKQLGLPNEKALIGRGVSYCAACDGRFYRNKTVAVVGGGNTAVSDALLLSRFCKKVHLLHRRDTLRAEAALQRKLFNANVALHFSTRPVAFIGTDKLTGVVLQRGDSQDELPLDGLFIAIGRTPETALFKGQLDTDESGYLPAGEDTKTALAGVFAAGDIRRKPLRQIVTATADGAVAAHQAIEYLQDAAALSF